MFGIILERFLTLTDESVAELKSTENSNTINMLPEDAKVILPSLKVDNETKLFDYELQRFVLFILDLVRLAILQ